MPAEHWQSATEIFDAAVERLPNDRAAFLAQRCGGDEALRRRVELLLKYHEQSDGFIETPAFALAPELLLDDAATLIGQQLGHYRIESILGVGGMGVVYLAHDEQLGRKVGLKLLPRSFVADEAKLGRLKREARTASALNHPNIVTIHEIGEVDGTHYIATEFIEGTTLRERMTRGPIPPNEALEIALQIASALSVAHAAGIVHRDIKPENIMLRPDGYVKMLDFGIAKFTQREALAGATPAGAEGMTQDGIISGTTRYMSPEQVRGEAVDARSDIWSLGVTFYEMVAGGVPFTGETPNDVIAAIMQQEPPLLTPAALGRVIGRMLAKERAARYQSAAELRADLQRLQRKAESVGQARWRIAAAAIAALAVAAIVYVKVFSPAPAPSLHGKSIAVLPFENLSAEKENAFFADGVHDEILTNLAKVADLKVISRTSVMSFRDTKRNLREIAQALGVAHIVEGSVQRAGGRIRVSAQLIDARTDTHLWAEHYNRDFADVFAIQSEIAQQIAGQLRTKLSPAERAAIAERPTADLVAYALYNQARELDIWGNWEGAEKSLTRKVELLEKATQRDPSFALALCALAKTRAHLFSATGGTGLSRTHLELAKKAADAALRVRPDLGEAHLELARHYFLAGDFDRARDELIVARRKLPNNSEAIFIAARIDRRQNRWDDSLANFQKASELDPRNSEVAFWRRGTYFEMRRYKELEQLLTKDAASGLLQDPSSEFELAQIKLATGDPVAAQALLAQIPLDFSPIADIWDTRFTAALYLRDYDAANRVIAATPAKFADRFRWVRSPDGLVALARGDKQKAQSIFLEARKRLDAMWGTNVKDEQYFASIAELDAGLGRKEEAIREAQRAVDLKPIAGDSLQGPQIATTLALVYAWTGERDRALEQLEIVAKIPAGPTYGNLRFNPCWDNLRGDPRFDKIVASLAPEPAAPSPNEKSIAVLPFDDLSGEKENAFFANGVHDEILTNLAKVADLKVISRTSVMSFRDTKRNLRDIAQTLGVARIVEGSVQRAGGRVRVNAQLIDARTDTHLWAERYDRELADVFAIQSEIAQKIVAQLKAALSPTEQAAINARPTQDMLAYDFYLRAKEIERDVSGALPERLNEKVFLLDQAVARDAAFVPALCLLARAHLEIYWFNLDHTEARLELATKALDAAARGQPDAGEVHLARAIRYYWGSRDYASALAELALARRALPNDADTLQFLAFIERRQGRWNESIRHLEEARTLDPRNAATIGELGFGYVSLRRYPDAARVFEEVLVWNPDDFGVQLDRALVDVEAKADLRRLQSIVFGETAKAGDAALLAAVRIRLALWQRDYHAAEQALSAYPGPDIAERGYITPREFFTASILRGRGDPANAQTAFLAARERAAAMVAERPDDAKALIVLAEIDARLGRKTEAIREGEEASKLLPVSKDAFDGPDILARLAGVLAQVGETRRALDLLEQVTKMPGAPSLTRPCYGRLQLDEVWDPLRGDPRFEKIVNPLAPR